jgi:hypothetical protein
MIDGGRRPPSARQRTLRTLFLRAPYADWAALVHGHKQEFRTPPSGALAAVIDTPTPVVLYAIPPARTAALREALMVLVEHRVERLHDIAGNHHSLMREGFASYDEFRAYWKKRTHRPYRAMDTVHVFRLEPYLESAKARLGEALLARLYGDYLDQQPGQLPR